MRFTVNVPNSVVAEIDQKRGLQSRATFAGNLIQQGLQHTPENIMKKFDDLLNGKAAKVIMEQVEAELSRRKRLRELSEETDETSEEGSD